MLIKQWLILTFNKRLKQQGSSTLVRLKQQGSSTLVRLKRLIMSSTNRSETRIDMGVIE